MGNFGDAPLVGARPGRRFFWKSFWKGVDILFVWWYNNNRVKKGIDIMKKTYVMNDRTFEISVKWVCGPLYNIEIREVKHPNRKFFRKEFFSDDYCRNINDFETVDEMLLDALKRKFALEEEAEKENKKWDDFKKSLDN